MTQQGFQSDTELASREELLAALGFSGSVDAESWSQDTGEAIVFNAWKHLWECDDSGRPLRYQVRVSGFTQETAQQSPRPGFLKWHEHVDLALGGERKALAIIPVAIDPDTTLNKGWKGWKKMCVIGTVHRDKDGSLWLVSDEIENLNV